RPEIEPGLVCLWRWWGFKKVGDRAAVHQVGSDEPGKGKRACNDFGGVVSQAQQQEGDQRDRDLNADGVFGGSEEVADLQSLLDPSKEQLDRPSSLVQVGDLLRARREIIGENAQHLAGIVSDPDFADEARHLVAT